MIWSEKTKEAVARRVVILSGYQEDSPGFDACVKGASEDAEYLLAAVAESDEWKAKDQEIAEQCRIIGASGSRELKLLGEIERLKQPTIGSDNTQTVYNLLAENERLKRQVSVLREDNQHLVDLNDMLKAANTCYCQRPVAADKIGEE